MLSDYLLEVKKDNKQWLTINVTPNSDAHVYESFLLACKLQRMFERNNVHNLMLLLDKQDVDFLAQLCSERANKAYYELERRGFAKQFDEDLEKQKKEKK
jgi:hypothetical protein